MNKNKLISILLVITFMFLISCNDDDDKIINPDPTPTTTPDAQEIIDKMISENLGDIRGFDRYERKVVTGGVTTEIDVYFLKGGATPTSLKRAYTKVYPNSKDVIVEEMYTTASTLENDTLKLEKIVDTDGKTVTASGYTPYIGFNAYIAKITIKSDGSFSKSAGTHISENLIKADGNKCNIFEADIEVVKDKKHIYTAIGNGAGTLASPGVGNIYTKK